MTMLLELRDVVVAKDNLASLRVLQKCGFTIVGEDRGFANAHNAETDGYLLNLA